METLKRSVVRYNAWMPEAHESRALALRARRLLGRDRELAEIAESVRCRPVTTLVGPGGVGKTVLATAATIPKSVSAPRLAENFAARTIALTSAERASIAKLDRGYRMIAGDFWCVPGTPWTRQTRWDEPAR